MVPNELNIPYHAHNHANKEETEELHPENSDSRLFSNIDFQDLRVGLFFLKYLTL